MPGSTAAARAWSASTSGWSSDSPRTRAITLRCSVILRPFSAQSASMSMLRVMASRLNADRGKEQRPRARKAPSPPGRGRRLREGPGPLFLRRALALGAEADLLGEGATLLGIIGGDHRIVGVEAPLLPILVRRQVVMGHQVPLEHLQLLAVFETDNIVRLDR